MSRTAIESLRAARLERERKAELLFEVGHLFVFASHAIRDADPIAGAMLGERIPAALAALPGGWRDAFTEALSDDAARGLRADVLYAKYREQVSP